MHKIFAEFDEIVSVAKWKILPKTSAFFHHILNVHTKNKSIKSNALQSLLFDFSILNWMPVEKKIPLNVAHSIHDDGFSFENALFFGISCLEIGIIPIVKFIAEKSSDSLLICLPGTNEVTSPM